VTDTIATTETGATRMPKLGDAADVERKLRAGGPDAWLTPGEMGLLFNKHRSSIDRWLNSRLGVKMGGTRRRIRSVESPGGHRKANPADVIWLLDAWRNSQKAAETDPPAES
jgi:hypothetical protein